MLKIFQLSVLALGLTAVYITPAEAAETKGAIKIDVAQSFNATKTPGSRPASFRVRPHVRQRVPQQARRQLRRFAEPVPHAAPELDPAGASAVALILLGVGAMLFDRRQRA
ncbi:MAG: hypothetical protein AAFN74_17485 [Myxococcota bacterium]